MKMDTLHYYSVTNKILEFHQKIILEITYISDVLRVLFSPIIKWIFFTLKSLQSSYRIFYKTDLCLKPTSISFCLKKQVLKGKNSTTKSQILNQTCGLHEYLSVDLL